LPARLIRRECRVARWRLLGGRYAASSLFDW
jgi:hypothetical protein